MKLVSAIFAAGSLLAPVQSLDPNGPLWVTYYENWAIYGRNYAVSDLDKYMLQRDFPFSALVVNHAFFAADESDCRLRSLDVHADTAAADPAYKTDWSQVSGILGNYMSLKRRYGTDFVLMMSLGGWSKSHSMQKCVQPENRQVYIQSIIDTIKAYGMDGVDFDWEYPGCAEPCGCQGEQVCSTTPNKSSRGDWEVFKSFLSDMKAELKKLEASLGRKMYNTMAIGMNPDLLRGGTSKYPDPTPIEWMCEDDTMDWINMMTYDFFGTWLNYASPLAPLYGSPDSNGETDGFNIDYSVEYLLSRCKNPGKLTMGLATYGKAWQNVPDVTAGTSPKGMWQTVTSIGWNGPGAMGTLEAGNVSIWDIIKNWLPKCEHSFDVHTKTEALYCATNPKQTSEKNVFVSYDGPEAWKEKMAYAKARGMAGAIVWASSDLGQNRTPATSLDVHAQMIGGALEGWFGRKVDIKDAEHLGSTPWNPTLKWSGEPCPLAAVWDKNTCPEDSYADNGNSNVGGVLSNSTGVVTLPSGGGSGTTPTTTTTKPTTTTTTTATTTTSHHVTEPTTTTSHHVTEPTTTTSHQVTTTTDPEGGCDCMCRPRESP